MEVGSKFIGMVKKNTKGFFKDIIDNIKNYWSGGSYLFLRIKLMVPGGMPFIAIGYNYNVWKVIYLIVKDTVGRTQEGFLYLYKYPDQFANVSICPVARPLVMSKKSAVNEVDSHNKSRQSDLALEKWWVTQCGWLRLCTTVAMGMNITDNPVGVKLILV